MINAIKMEFYKMFKSKSTWVIILIILFAAFFTVLSNKILITEFKNNPQFYQQFQEQMDGKENYNVGFSAKIQGNMNDYINGMKMNVPYLLSSILNGSMLTGLIAIFCLIFFNSEIRTGYIKNIIGQFHNRGNLILSKVSVIIAYCVLSFISVFAGILISSRILLGYVEWGNSTFLIKLLLTHLLLNIAVCTLLLLITYFLRNTVGTLIIGLAIVLGVSNIIFSLLSKLIKYFNIVKSESFSLTNYTLTGNISSLTSMCKSSDFVRSVIVACIFIIVCTISSIVVVNKKDVN